MKNVLLFILATLVTYSTKAQCSAGATYTISGLTVNLTNTSSPSPLTTIPGAYAMTYVNYGSTNQNFYITSSHTYSTAGTYGIAIIHEVRDSLTNSILCADLDSLMITVGSVACNISISKTQNANFFTFNANNLSSTPGMTYSWNFGDGNTGTGSPVTHTYAAGGTYTVTLTGSSTSASCTKTVTTTVTVPTVPPNAISGMVVGDSTKNDTFKVWLIKFDSTTNILWAVDSTYTVTGMSPGSGHYQFNGKPAGIYRTKAARFNGPTSGTGFVPTYHTMSLYWNTATLIYHIGGNSTGKHIFMQTGTLTSGPGFVAGNVTMGANKGTSGAVPGMLMFLRDNMGNLVSYTYTDANGDYSFGNIPTGSYTVYPEEGGFTTTPSSFIISSFTTTVNGLGFEKHDVARTITPKTSGITNIADGKLGIYPNPAFGKVHISLGSKDQEATVSITDVTGRHLFLQQVTLRNGQADLNIQQLLPGNYFMTVENAHISVTEKIMVK